MSPTRHDRQTRVYKIEREDGRRYVIYNAGEIGNPPDHAPDKWYFRPYPMPEWEDVGEPYDTAEEAERAAMAQPVRAHGVRFA